MKEYSVVLEGGGAKGAYQIGAIKALIENGYSFNAIVGTSIGAINAAFIAQGDIDKIEKLWKTLSFKDLMDINNDIMENLMTRQITMSVIRELRDKLNIALKEKGIDTVLMRNILAQYIDEDKIRNSSIRYGLVTFCITDFKPQKLFIEDIPKGKLIDYLLASSNLPVFKRAQIDEKKFLDGGAFDNCSAQMLYDAGYRNIMAIRLFTRNKIRNYSRLIKDKELDLEMIAPSVDLPSILNFHTSTLNTLLEYGYIDTIKQLNRLDGRYYAFERISSEEIEEYKSNLTPMVCLEFVKQAKVKYKPGDNIVDIMFSKVVPRLNKNLSETKTTVFKKQLINIVEYIARNENIKSNKIYNFNEFIINLKSKIEKKNKNKLTSIEKIAYELIEKI